MFNLRFDYFCVCARSADIANVFLVTCKHMIIVRHLRSRLFHRLTLPNCDTSLFVSSPPSSVIIHVPGDCEVLEFECLQWRKGLLLRLDTIQAMLARRDSIRFFTFYAIYVTGLLSLSNSSSFTLLCGVDPYLIIPLTKQTLTPWHAKIRLRYFTFWLSLEGAFTLICVDIYVDL